MRGDMGYALSELKLEELFIRKEQYKTMQIELLTHAGR